MKKQAMGPYESSIPIMSYRTKPKTVQTTLPLHMFPSISFIRLFYQRRRITDGYVASFVHGFNIFVDHDPNSFIDFIELCKTIRSRIDTCLIIFKYNCLDVHQSRLVDFDNYRINKHRYPTPTIMGKISLNITVNYHVVDTSYSTYVV